MSNPQSNFVKVADLKELPEGTPKAVRVEGRSIALFQHQGSVYATDNQCPHMGYPLTRGRVRNGVLTCDWHGWSYDMKGGGCFTGGCDDLDTFPVEVRDSAIYIDVRSGGSKRKDAHFLLLKEGLLSADNWTLSKAIAIMLAQGVSEQDTLKRVVRHMGRHIATESGANEGGRELALMVNGVKVARHYEPDDRLIPLHDGGDRRVGPRRRSTGGPAAAAAGNLGQAGALDPCVLGGQDLGRDREVPDHCAAAGQGTTSGSFRCSMNARSSLSSSVTPRTCRFWGISRNCSKSSDGIRRKNWSAIWPRRYSAGIAARRKNTAWRRSRCSNPSIHSSMNWPRRRTRDQTAAYDEDALAKGSGERRSGSNIQRNLECAQGRRRHRSNGHYDGPPGRRPHGADPGEPEPRLGKSETGADTVILGSNRPALWRLQDRRQSAVPCRLAILQRSLAQHHAPFPHRAPERSQIRCVERRRRRSGPCWTPSRRFRYAKSDVTRASI